MLLRRPAHLLVAITYFLVCSVVAQTTAEQCTTGFPAESSLQPDASLSELVPETREGGGIQVIAPGLKFSCHGEITGWNALLTIGVFSFLNPKLFLQVWRPSFSAEGKFELIDSRQLIEPQRSSLITIGNQTFLEFIGQQIPEKERLSFQPGDVIGWFSPQRINTANPGAGVALQNNVSGSDLISVFVSGAKPNESYEVYTSDSAVTHYSSSLPLIRVEINETSTGGSSPDNNCTSSNSCNITTTTPTLQTTLPTPPSHTTPPSRTTPPTPPTPPVNMIDYIIAGVVPGSLVIILFVICGVIVMVCCYRGDNKFTGCVKKLKRCEHTNPTYDNYADPDDFIQLDQPISKPLGGNLAFLNDSPLSTTPIGFTEDSTHIPKENPFDGQNYATTYQTNGENHIYHELVQTPEPRPPPLPHRSSVISVGSYRGTSSHKGRPSTGSLKGKPSTRFSIQSITQFPYTMPNTPAPSFPYLEAVPTVQTPARPLTPQESPPSSASSVSEKSPAMRKLFHALDEEGFRVPDAKEREMFSESHVEELYSRLHRPHSYTKSRNSRDSTFFEPADIYWEPSSSSTGLFNQLARRKYREIKRDNIKTLERLGGGHFSTVHKGIWEVPGGSIEVAVKTLKPKASETDKVKFLQEAAIMGQFLHPNVLKLQGVVTIGDPIMIILEVMPKGDLKNYLRSLRSKPKNPDLPKLFLRFCREVAFGMNYLSNKGYVHRDLAARNILLTDDDICKIADFGMARDLDIDNIYQSQGGKIPLKWTAPEGLKHRQYSSASDVWSYGMLLFEIWTLGRKPYEGASTNELMDFMEAFHCQPPPPGTPRTVYRLMVQCWHPVPMERPSFSEICTYLNSTDEVLLNWSSADKAIGPRVTELGAPLSEGIDLYLDLQHMYDESSLTRNENSGSVTIV